MHGIEYFMRYKVAKASKDDNKNYRGTVYMYRRRRKRGNLSYTSTQHNAMLGCFNSGRCNNDIKSTDSVLNL